jgi:ABC-2 type transport system ATP-binding protein
MPSAAVQVDDLRKRYGDTRAVDGLSFAAASGAVTALLGPNGAGKTTTVEICEGFRRPDGGRVQVLGLDPRRDGRRLKPRVGVMLQQGGAYPGARAGEMLRLLAAFAADPVDPASLLDRLGLTGAARTPYRRLSGGQRQRLSLAMAVVGRPEVLFLDEPTAGLDPQARHAAWELVAELRAAGVAVVLTTHDMVEAAELADRVIIVDRGRVVAAGTPAELTGASSPTLRWRSRPALDLIELIERLGPERVTAEESPGVYRVSPADSATVATVAGWAAETGVPVDGLSLGSRSLEDVFLELTGRELRS